MFVWKTIAISWKPLCHRCWSNRGKALNSSWSKCLWSVVSGEIFLCRNSSTFINMESQVAININTGQKGMIGRFILVEKTKTQRNLWSANIWRCSVLLLSTLSSPSLISLEMLQTWTGGFSFYLELQRHETKSSLIHKMKNLQIHRYTCTTHTYKDNSKKIQHPIHSCKGK